MGPAIRSLALLSMTLCLACASFAEARQKPSIVVTRGFNADSYVENTFTRLKDGRWEERNSGKGRFRAFYKVVEEDDSNIVLLDAARGMYLRINLERQMTFWRLQRDKEWTALYKVIEMK